MHVLVEAADVRDIAIHPGVDMLPHSSVGEQQHCTVVVVQLRANLTLTPLHCSLTDSSASARLSEAHKDSELQ